jgi:4-diphosphocytidyl-2-C-methyl-D-erythritol kinase
LFDTPCFVTGRGEVIEPITLDLKGLHLVLINPGIHISTAEAFRMIKPQTNYTNLKEAVRMSANEWQQHLKNDFEDPACALYPEISKALHTLNEAGAIYSSMTGSGSTVYGLFSKKPVLAECPSHWFIHGSTF